MPLRKLFEYDEEQGCFIGYHYAGMGNNITVRLGPKTNDTYQIPTDHVFFIFPSYQEGYNLYGTVYCVKFRMNKPYTCNTDSEYKSLFTDGVLTKLSDKAGDLIEDGVDIAILDSLNVESEKQACLFNPQEQVISMSLVPAVDTNGETDISKIMKDLVDEIRGYNYSYYVLNQPAVPDVIFDRKFKLLQALESRYPESATVHSS